MTKSLKWKIKWILSWLTPFVMMVVAFAPFFIG